MTPLPLLEWTAIVTPRGNVTGPASVTRSRLRAGHVPSGSTMIRWARQHGLRFTVDAEGVRCERVEPNGGE